ncbi:BMP family ABC transporter substrate-binding protein [Acrocarpospora catenulata]|uniref:BMP family ABC transporter substrate-binding protein n=1 Tax=Acrocarpospora catenulata TaxID=2836182 RepID=UPI001BDA51E1|nr:BMP family ABC transporter substrate-binding protein [Acrocarpospora catenulata]
MSRSRLFTAAVAAGSLILATACGATTDETTGGGDGQKTIRVGVALAGPRNDNAFYQTYLEGVTQNAEAMNLKVSVVDNLTDPQQITDALTNLAADNDLIIGGGSALVAGANAVAAANPDTTFVMSGVVKEGVSNLHAYMMLQGVPAYVAGVLAAGTSKTGKVGFIGGAQIPPTSQSDIDFKAGARATKPDIGYAAVTVGSFSDATKAKQAAAAQITDGVDVIYAFVDAGLPGVLQAIEESGKYVKVFNPTTDRCAESDALIGYDYQNNQQLVTTILQDYLAGKLPAGTKKYALEDPKIQKLTMCPNSAQLQAQADEITAKINAGEITMPEGG